MPAEEKALATAPTTAFPLSPTQLDAFAARSTTLGGILRAGEITRILATYERENRRAMYAQSRFVRVSTHLNASVLATAVIGALILALGLLKSSILAIGPAFENGFPWLLAGLGLLGLLVSGYAAGRLYELKAGDLAGDWMRSRAQAEKARSEYFDRLATLAAKQDRETQVAALDLVNAHLLEDQLGYFTRRGTRHEESAGRWLRVAAFATGLASVGVAAGGLAGAVGQTWILTIAALGSIGGAIAAFAAAQETIGQERERAQRFRNNVDALELLARRTDDVRIAIANGSPDALGTFTSTINQQLALELGRFLEGGDSIRASIEKLGQQIEESRKGRSDDSQQQQPKAE